MRIGEWVIYDPNPAGQVFFNRNFAGAPPITAEHRAAADLLWDIGEKTRASSDFNSEATILIFPTFSTSIFEENILRFPIGQLIEYLAKKPHIESYLPRKVDSITLTRRGWSAYDRRYQQIN